MTIIYTATKNGKLAGATQKYLIRSCVRTFNLLIRRFRTLFSLQYLVRAVFQLLPSDSTDMGR